MARKFLKDSDGLQLITSSDNRQRAFQVAETIADDLGVEAVITKVRDPETGGYGLGIYIVSKESSFTPELTEEAIRIWNEFI